MIIIIAIRKEWKTPLNVDICHVREDIVCSACGKAIDNPELLNEAQSHAPRVPLLRSETQVH